MIPAFQKDDALLADIRAHENEAGFRLWWLGQSGFLLQYQNLEVLFDPYLSDSLTEKYATTDKPHVRMTERVIAPEVIGLELFTDILTSSHNHTDHLDAATIHQILSNSEQSFVIPEANRAFVCERLGYQLDTPVGLDDGKSKQVGPFTFHAIASAHNELETDELGRHKFLGYVVQFGDFTVYHSGDTLLYDGLIEKLKPFKIDVALLPINGNKPERRVAGNMNGAEAAFCAKEIGAKWVIPHHFEMFEFNTASPAEFIENCEKLGQKYRVLRAGERFDFEAAP
jgi:L-ascorbate metabolism protein UlaG (beta-lactamase superfamily)